MNQESRRAQSEPVQPFVIDTFDCRVLEPSVPSLIPKPRIEPLDDVSQLDDFSQAFVERLLIAHSEWRPLLQKISSDEGWALWLELPAPSAKVSTAWVSTEDGQVTVGLGRSFHAHFCSCSLEPDIKAMDRALQFLDDFLAERLVLVTAVGHATGIESADVSDERLTAWIKEYRCDLLRLESWRGTFDRDFITWQTK